MSVNLSRLVEPFVTSVVVGKDVVPRVSVANLGRLIDQMVPSLKAWWLLSRHSSRRESSPTSRTPFHYLRA